MLIVVNIKTAIVAAAFAAGPLVASAWMVAVPEQHGAVEAPAMVELASGTMQYWAPGEFTRDGKPANAPRITVTIHRPLAIMRREVTAAEYQRCVDEHACAARAGAPKGPNMPAVMVSWRDAQAYAKWLSRKLGVRYRLPTDEEWTYAAGSRAPDESPIGLDSNDPAKWWLARYEREANAEPKDKDAKPVGSFGVNEHGLLDISGNVWEWTSDCFTGTALGQASAPAAVQSRNCGVRVAEGPHRAYISDFIRDARGGGCAAGAPPSNLGFRLVRDDRADWRASMKAWFAARG
jgi:formylglycine-generating enzyme required for sulfatase activity